jgi:hypothetical protein
MSGKRCNLTLGCSKWLHPRLVLNFKLSRFIWQRHHCGSSQGR